MDNTPNLSLPYIIGSQSQKHVTHNEAIRALDAIVQLSVLDRDLTAPPGSPSEGDRYLIATSASGDWAGHDHKIVAYQDGAWAVYQPVEGWLAWVADEDQLLAFDGTNWGVAGGSINPAALVGINTTADTTNRLSVSSPASLFNHEGAGHQIKVNKDDAPDTASFLFQTDFDGRAEIGLTGDDDFHFKVSPDGTNWHEGIIIDKDDGRVSFPGTPMREVLDADRTYFVATGGSDSNDGLTSGTPFATIQKAVDEAVTLDAGGYTVTISVAAGTYTDAVLMNTPMIGTARLLIRGDTATPSNVVIDTPGSHCFAITTGAKADIGGFKLVGGSTWGSGVHADSGADVRVREMEYGSLNRHQIDSLAGSFVDILADYTISGDAGRHIVVDNNSVLRASNRTVTVTGTPDFTEFINVASSASVSLWNHAITGSATGKRYSVTLNAALNTYGKGVNFFPGDVAGTTATGGEYA